MDNYREKFMPFDDLEALVLVANKKGEVVFANAAVKTILGYEPEELLNEGWWSLTAKQGNVVERKNLILDMLNGNQSIAIRHLYENPVQAKDGRVVWTQWTNKLTEDGYLVGIAQDITQKKELERKLQQKNQENELLLKEIHHRVKNNLQIIVSLLNLQFNTIEDGKVFDALSKSKERISSMALIHNRLYQSNNLATIEFGEYIGDLTQSISESYRPNQNIKLVSKHSDAVFSMDLAINLGLIITELVTNAYKHAFKSKKQGEIAVEIAELNNSRYRLVIKDNGDGMASNREKDTSSFGLELVDALVEQIDGTISVEAEDGVKYAIEFEN